MTACWNDSGGIMCTWGITATHQAQVDFRQAKEAFVHELVRWSGLDQLPRGSRVLDVGCGIGGSARILARDYGFDVLGVSISPAQIRRATELTPEGSPVVFR